MASADDTNKMAQNSYGYGCWNASAWFIGPEQGMGAHESDDLSRRVEAWITLGSNELDDCFQFHKEIKECRWHGENAKLQRTWAKLILTYLEFSGLEKANRLQFQKTEWGFQPSDTCVIELSGLAAHNLTVNRDRRSFLDDRIRHINQKMQECRPQVLVLYGKSDACQKAWRDIASDAETIKTNLSFVELRKSNSTLLAWMPHPVAHGQTNENWTNLGSELRKLAEARRRLG